MTGTSPPPRTARLAGREGWCQDLAEGLAGAAVQDGYRVDLLVDREADRARAGQTGVRVIAFAVGGGHRAMLGDPRA